MRAGTSASHALAGASLKRLQQYPTAPNSPHLHRGHSAARCLLGRLRRLAGGHLHGLRQARRLLGGALGGAGGGPRRLLRHARGALRHGGEGLANHAGAQAGGAAGAGGGGLQGLEGCWIGVSNRALSGGFPLGIPLPSATTHGLPSLLARAVRTCRWYCGAASRDAGIKYQRHVETTRDNK